MPVNAVITISSKLSTFPTAPDSADGNPEDPPAVALNVIELEV